MVILLQAMMNPNFKYHNFLSNPIIKYPSKVNVQSLIHTLDITSDELNDDINDAFQFITNRKRTRSNSDGTRIPSIETGNSYAVLNNVNMAGNSEKAAPPKKVYIHPF